MSLTANRLPTAGGPGSVSEAPHLPAGFTDTFATVDVLPGHRCRDGHRVVRAVRGRLLPHREGDRVVLGRPICPKSSGARSRSPRRFARATNSSPASPRWWVIVNEADGLGDKGEAYPACLRGQALRSRPSDTTE